MLRPTRLSRYVLSELWTPTLLAIALWVSLLLMNELFHVARIALANDLDLVTTLELLLLYVPQTMILAIPMGTLLGTLIAIGRLSADHEFVALQSLGLGRRFLFRPVLAHGVFFTLLALLVYNVVQPAAVLKMRTLSTTFVRAANLVSDLRPRVFLDPFPGLLLYVEDIPAGTRGRLQGVLLYRSDPTRSSGEEMVVAKEAFVSESTTLPNAVRIDLRDGVQHDFGGKDQDVYRVTRFRAHVPEPIKPPDYLLGRGGSVTRGPSDMETPRLIRELEIARREPDPPIREARVRNTLLEINSRFALPLSCLLFALLSLPLGVSRVRSGKGAGFAISLGIILGYYLTYVTLRTQAAYGRVPLWTLWIADSLLLLFTAAAYVRFGKPPRDRNPLFRRLWDAAAAVVDRVRPGPKVAAVPAAGGADLEVRPGSRLVAILDRYVGLLYLRLFFLSLAFAWIVVFLIELKSVLDGIAEKTDTSGLLLPYLANFTPGSLGLAVPIACLMGAVVCCTLLGRSGELTAMKAAGVSMRRVTGPILLLTLLLSGALFVIQDQIAPQTNRSAQALKDRLQGRAPRTYGAAPGGRWTWGNGGRLYHYRFYDPVEERFQGLSAYVVDFQTPRIVSHVSAATARWDGFRWLLSNGWQRTFPDDGSVDFRRIGTDEPFPFDPPDNFARREATLAEGNDLPDQMSLGELGEEIADLSSSGFDTTRLRVDWHSKIARPLMPVVMVLLGLPFAFKVGRRGSLYGVGVALLLVIAYWAVAALSNALGVETILSPAVAAWAPNVVFALLGGYLMLYVKT